LCEGIRGPGVIREAVAAVKADPEMAVRLGQRAVELLIAKLDDPDKAARGAAANALMQLGDERAVEPLRRALGK
jgi:HEAT repeat protein